MRDRGRPWCLCLRGVPRGGVACAETAGLLVEFGAPVQP